MAHDTLLLIGTLLFVAAIVTAAFMAAWTGRDARDWLLFVGPIVGAAAAWLWITGMHG